jgi:hypothetical protein
MQAMVDDDRDLGFGSRFPTLARLSFFTAL